METLVLSTFLLWFGLAIIVGVAAETRRRIAIGWFVLALVISPLLAGLLLLALPRFFKAQGVLAGMIPYRVTASGVVEAMMQGGLVRFKNMDEFRAAFVEGRDAPPVDADSRDTDSREFPDVMDGIRYKINDDDTVTARTPMGERTYSNWDSFLKATKKRRW